MFILFNYCKTNNSILYLGGFGYDFSTLGKKTVEQSVDVVAKGILQHGVTSFCPTVITSSPQMYSQVKIIQKDIFIFIS